MNDFSRITRRRFVQGSLVTAAAFRITRAETAPVPLAPKPTPTRAHGSGVVDTNVYLGRWPFRRLHCDDTPALVQKLKQQGVTEAWAGSLNGLLHKDIAGVNERLAEDCRTHGDGMLHPFGSVNLTLPEWEEDLRRCHEVHQMPGIRVQPGYHGYKLDDPRFVELLRLAADRKLVVQLVLSMEDERTQHPLVRVPTVDISPLPKALEAAPVARVMVLNWPRVAGKPVLLALQGSDVHFDVAMLEGIAGIEAALDDMPIERLCFGSFAPVFYHAAATLKLTESALSDEQLAAISSGNARRFLKG